MQQLRKHSAFGGVSAGLLSCRHASQGARRRSGDSGRRRQPGAREALLDAKADSNARAMNGGTALMAASVKGYPEVVRALLAAKADVNARTGDGQNGTFVRGAEWAEGDCATAQGGWSSRTVRRGHSCTGDCRRLGNCCPVAGVYCSAPGAAVTGAASAVWVLSSNALP